VLIVGGWVTTELAKKLSVVDNLTSSKYPTTKTKS